MCVIFDSGHYHLESCLSTSPLTCDLAGLFKSKHGGFFACLFVCLFCFVSVFAGAIVCDHLSHAVILSCIKKCLYCCYYYCDFFSQWVGSDRDRTVERYPRKYYTPEIFYWLFLKLKKLFCCLKGLTIEQQVWKSALHVGHCSMKLWKWIFFFFFFFGVLLCILYCGVCFLFFLEKVFCVDQRTIRTIRSNSKPQILKAHSRLYPFSFLATVVSDENEF